MAGNEKQNDINKPNQRPDILRAKDIIPGAGRNEIEEDGASDIPRFDLAKDIMSEHRRLTAAHRKRPGFTAEHPEKSERFPGLSPRNPKGIPEDAETAEKKYKSIPTNSSHLSIKETHFVSDEGRWASSDWDPLIADIVTRDIERFCAGVQ